MLQLCLFLSISLVPFTLGTVTKVVGGEAAVPGQFPYQVFVEKIWNSTKIYKCGGAILNEQFVITAAHCLFFRDKGEFSKPRKIWITAGIHDLTSKDPEVKRFEQVTWAKGLFPHPKFRFEGNIPIYDIAVVKLNKKFKLTKRVAPIPLPLGHEPVLKGNGTVSGWGRLDPNGRWSRQLHHAQIPIVEWQQCARIFGSSAPIKDNMFCSGTKDGGLTPCMGDSGGPIVCNNTLCGIASFGGKGCLNYSVYTRISSYLQWIQEIISSS